MSDYVNLSNPVYFIEFNDLLEMAGITQEEYNAIHEYNDMMISIGEG